MLTLYLVAMMLILHLLAMMLILHLVAMMLILHLVAMILILHLVAMMLILYLVAMMLISSWSLCWVMPDTTFPRKVWKSVLTLIREHQLHNKNLTVRRIFCKKFRKTTNKTYGFIYVTLTHLFSSRKGIARPQSQFPHSLVCERFIYSHDRST